MFAEERQEKIMEMLNRTSSLKVAELANSFNVSESTIRRDLQDMEQSGMLTRTHGGAVVNSRTSFEPSFKEKETERHDEKVEIGVIAASMIEDGDTIILDSGTTSLEIARHITSHNVTVITNSIDIAYELSLRDDIEVIVAGGNLRKNTRAMVGHIAEQTLSNFRVDIAFIGANGISMEEGITTPNFTEAQTKKSMIKVANRVIVSADSSKFNQVCFSVICPLKEVNSIITSSDVDESIIKGYRDSGVEILR